MADFRSNFSKEKKLLLQIDAIFFKSINKKNPTPFTRSWTIFSEKFWIFVPDAEL